jgi:hypothetical protein
MNAPQGAAQEDDDSIMLQGGGENVINQGKRLTDCRVMIYDVAMRDALPSLLLLSCP